MAIKKMLNKNNLKALLSRPEFSALAIFIFLMILFSFVNDRFLNSRNFMVILATYPELALVALGITILMISGEFDLSVGSVFAVSPIVTMILIADYELNFILSIFFGIFSAAIIGFINAITTVKFKIPSFIATLGMLFMARSLAVVISDGFPPSVPKDLPIEWLVGRVDMLRVSIFWLIGIAIICNFILKKTNLGNWIFATGENKHAAKDLGINTFRVKVICFVLCSVLAGFAGIIQSFRIGSVITSLGQGLELQAIASAVVGGASLMGGIGSAFGALIGTLLLSIIDNILILSRIDGNWFKFAVGALIVIAVILNTITKNSADKIRLKDDE
jgi:ribose/xylose/arabinose/galactoside ABC-type transport system permease subunit